MRTTEKLQNVPGETIAAISESNKLYAVHGSGDIQFREKCKFYLTAKKYVISKCEDIREGQADHGTLDSLIRCTAKYVNYLSGAFAETAKVIGLALDSAINNKYAEYRMDIIKEIMKIGEAPNKAYILPSWQDIKVMELYYVEGMETAEVGSILNLSQDKVTSSYMNMIYYFASIYHGAKLLETDND